MTRPLANVVAANLVAFFGPLGLVVVTFAWLGHLEPWTASASVRLQDETLAATPPDIVILGNSLAIEDVDGKALSAALDLGPTVTLRENASPAPTWYAMLKFRLYEANYQPKLVLVVNSLTAMLLPRPVSATDMARMEQHFAEPDEVLSRKVFGGSRDPWRDRVEDRRTRLHQDGLNALRKAAAGAEAEGILASIFAAEHLRASERHVVGPIVEREVRGAKRTADGWEASVMPDIVALAKARGAKVVFVRVPIARSQPRYDDVSAGVEAEVIGRLNEVGGGWLDLRSMTDSEADFTDGRHMNARGRERFTALLAARLKEMGALGNATMAPARLPMLPSRVERVGIPKLPVFPAPKLTKSPCGYIAPWGQMAFLSDGALQKAGLRVPSPLVVREDGVPLPFFSQVEDLGADCHGAFGSGGSGLRFSGTRADAAFDVALATDFPMIRRSSETWWLYPESRASVGYDRAWDRGAFSVSVNVVTVGEGPAPALVIGETRVPLTADNEGGFRATYEGAAPVGTWEMAIESPVGGAYSVVRRWAVGSGEDRVTLVDITPRVVTLFGQPFTCTEPPALPDPGPPNVGTVPWFEVPELGWLGRREITEIAGDRGSSPVLVSEDGTLLPRGNLQELKSGKRGMTSHFGDRVQFTPTDGRLDHRWGVALDPRRDVKHGRWVYPGDTCAVTVSPAKIRQTVRTLMASAATSQPVPEGASLRLTLHAGARMLVDDVIDWTTSAEGRTWTLAASEDEDMTLKLHSSPDMPIAFLKLLSVGDVPPLPLER